MDERDEREIERLITALVGVSLRYPMDEPPEPEEWPIATIFNMDKAAHAIAERLKARVVLECKVIFEIDGDGDIAGWCQELGDYVVFFIDRGELILGEPMCVTVTKPEGEDALGKG